MSEEKNTLHEAAAAYGSRRADLDTPIILERAGQPMAVILSFDEYRRLRSLAADTLERRTEAWAELDALLQTIHARPTDLSPEQIEQETSRARGEVKRRRRAPRSSR
jgi:hypothetical protein